MKKLLVFMLIVLIPYAVGCKSSTGNDDKDENGGDGGNGNVRYTVSGRVVDSVSGAGIPDVKMVLTDAVLSHDITTDSQGNFSFDNVTDGDYTLIPEKIYYTFSPPYLSFTVSGSNVTGRNFTGTLIGGGGGDGGETTFDLTGTWNYVNSNQWVEGRCPVGSPAAGICVITQTGTTFTLTSDAGTYSGTVSGATYSAATPTVVVDDEGGTATNSTIFTASSNTYASGTGSSIYAHPDGFQCVWGYDVTLTKITED